MPLQHVLKPDPGEECHDFSWDGLLTDLADDLNPLYVYEAKMSLFARMAQIRHGAERLLEAQILPVLAQCEFLDTRPEADQSFMGQCIF